MTEDKPKRRPKGPAALGNINETKIVVDAMTSTENDARREKSARLRASRLLGEKEEAGS